MWPRRSLSLAGLVLFILGSQPALADGDAPWLTQAAEAYAKGDLALALKHLGQRRLSAEGRLLRARIRLGLGQYARARRNLRQLVDELPHLRDQISFLQGEALFGLGDYLQAADYFRAAAQAKGSHWVDRAWRRRADALYAGGRYQLAADEYAHLLRAYSEHPERPELELLHARCLRQLDRQHEAAGALQEIWYRWPLSAVASEANVELQQLTARGIKPQPQPFWRKLQRALALRQGKRYDEALQSLEQLSQELGSSAQAEQTRLYAEQARTLVYRGQCAEALTLLEQRLNRRSADVWRLTAECLARLGRMDEASRVLSPARSARSAQHSIGELDRMSRFWAVYGRYQDAMQFVDQLVDQLPRKRRAKALLERTWLAYRAGRYEQAITGFQQLAKQSRRGEPFALYWEARAQGRAGHAQQEEVLYRQLLERHLRTYYGLQARGRLVELGKLKLSSSASCDNLPPVQGPAGDPQVPGLLAQLRARYGELYPALQRAQTLWKLGMLTDARRELRLVAIDFLWARARGRPRATVFRPEVERIWQGGPPERRRWNSRYREIFQQRQSLGPALGELMRRAGIFDYGWLLSPPHPDRVRQAHPRAYPDVVVPLAEQFDLDPNLIWAVMRTESAFRTDAVSRVGAVGLMQLMPTTARRIAAELKRDDFELSQLFDPETNLTLASWYLRALSTKFRGQLMLVAAAYNGGPHNVARWLDQRGQGADLDEFIEEIPFTESRRYAKKILRLVALYERVHCNRDDRVVSNALDLRYGDYPDY